MRVTGKTKTSVQDVTGHPKQYLDNPGERCAHSLQIFGRLLQQQSCAHAGQLLNQRPSFKLDS
jgi:hypothetical protein